MPKFAIKRISDPNDEHRCQGVVANGQCQNLAYQAEDGTFPGDKCVMHGGHQAAVRYHQESLKQYKITKYASRIQDFVTNPNVKSLREEIALLRILIEERMNAVKNEFDLIAASGPISELISKTERLVRTCQNIEKETSITLDRQQVMQMSDQIINAVINNIEQLELPEERVSDLLSSVMFDLQKVFKGEQVERKVSVVPNSAIPKTEGLDTKEEE